MSFVVGIAVAGADRKASTQPRLHTRKNFWLQASFKIQRIGALVLRAPTAGLHCSPCQRIEHSCRSCERVKRMGSIRFNANVFAVAAANRGRAVVSLENVPPVVIVQEEDSRVGIMFSPAP